jgi:hypothetical protein
LSFVVHKYKYISYIKGTAAKAQSDWTTKEARFDSSLFSLLSRPTLGAIKYPAEWVPRTVSLGVKQQRYDVNHSLPPSADIKNGETKSLFPKTSSWHGA